MVVLGVVAALLVTACVVPQLVVVLRSTTVEGVSVTGSTSAATSCAGWTLYAANVGLAEATWSSGLGATLWGTIAIIAATRPLRSRAP